LFGAIGVLLMIRKIDTKLNLSLFGRYYVYYNRHYELGRGYPS
jgi:hypothetical protein